MVRRQPFSPAQRPNKTPFFARTHDDSALVRGPNAPRQELGALPLDGRAVDAAGRGRGGVRRVGEQRGELLVVGRDDVDVAQRGVGVRPLGRGAEVRDGLPDDAGAGGGGVEGEFGAAPGEDGGG